MPSDLLRISFIGTGKQSTFRPITFHRNDLDFYATELPIFAENPEFSLGTFISSTPYTGNGLPLSHLSKDLLGWNSPHYWEDPFSDSALFAHIALVREGHPTIHFAIKVVLHVDDDPRSRGYNVYEALRREAVFYVHRLPTLQGDAVPRHYGVWESQYFMGWARRYLCDGIRGVVMVWANQRNKTRHAGDKNEDCPHATENPRRRGRSGPGYDHHLLYDWRCGKARIMDFTEGHSHTCARQVPLKPYKAQFRYGPPLCPELTTLGLVLGFGGPNTFLTEDAEVLDAIAFLEKYPEEHPGISRQEALDAQEKYLKEEWHLVGPEVRRTESGRCTDYEGFFK